MKKINFFLLIALGIFLVTLSSCSLSQTFMVQGVPGTVISSPNDQRLAVLDNMGQAQIKTKRRDGYYHYLLAQVPGTSLQVPFALDYKDKSRAFKRGFARTLNYTGAAITTISLLAAGIVSKDDGNTQPYGLAGLGGLGLLGIGAACGGLSDSSPILYDYNYEKQQITNNDVIK